MKEWTDFFVTTGGAAAALTGLIFVGVSISLARILSIPKLPGRAAQALILLLTVLIVSALCLVPFQPNYLLGIEIIFIGIIIWIITFRADLQILSKTDKQYKKQYLMNTSFTQLSVLPYIVAGIALLAGKFGGIYWLVPAFLFSFIKAVIDAWVLLVEINR
jgi:hypothetical protein